MANFGEKARFRRLAHGSTADWIVWESWAKAAGMTLRQFTRLALIELVERLGVRDTAEYIKYGPELEPYR